jgi:hypothetical protein
MAARRSLAGLDLRRLRLALAFFFLALAIPAGLLVHQAYGQLKWEAFHQYRTLAEELATRIDGRIGRLITKEESRSYADYGFLVVAGDPAANFLQPSPLSAFPVTSDIPGLVGYFQVDAKGDFSTPLVPASPSLAASYGISGPELVERRDLQERILRILSRNHLVQEPHEADRKAKLGTADALAPERSTPVSSGRLGTWSSVTGGESTRSEARPALKDKAEAQAAFDRLDQFR